VINFCASQELYDTCEQPIKARHVSRERHQRCLGLSFAQTPPCDADIDRKALPVGELVSREDVRHDVGLVMRSLV
jgi:hypothetical protein